MALGIQVSESVKDMEERVSEARCGIKVVNMDLGQESDNKALIVRKVLEEVRKRVKQEEIGQVNSVLRRTRVVLLGRRTESRRVGGRTVATVPVLFQCLDTKDMQVLEGGLRGAGFFPCFHWPEEIMEFINGVKREVREASKEQGGWIRVRPEEAGGKVRIRVDSKPKEGGRFKLKGVWVCPPLKRCYWEEVEGLYNPVRWVGVGGRMQEN